MVFYEVFRKLDLGIVLGGFYNSLTLLIDPWSFENQSSDYKI